MKKILYITLISCIGLTIMISCSEKEESSSSSSFTEDISFDPSSVPDNATTVAFGQSYQYQVGTNGTYLFRDDHIFSEQSAWWYDYLLYRAYWMDPL